MEDVWEDISLSSLHHRRPASASASAAISSQADHAGLILQDFLARAFGEDPPAARRERREPPSPGGDPKAPPPSAPSLKSALDPSPPDRPMFLQKLASEDDNSGDRRQKRMMKNRESAARSRARKQAYINELENEVAHLMEVNAKLKRQLEKANEMASLATPARLPQKHRLQRSLTAPF